MMRSPDGWITFTRTQARSSWEAPKNHDHDDHGDNDNDEESGWMDYLHSDTSQGFLGRRRKIMIMMTMVIMMMMRSPDGWITFTRTQARSSWEAPKNHDHDDHGHNDDDEE